MLSAAVTAEIGLYHSLGLFSKWQFGDIFLETRFWYFMQIVSTGDNLHEISKSAFWEK